MDRRNFMSYHFIITSSQDDIESFMLFTTNEKINMFGNVPAIVIKIYFFMLIFIVDIKTLIIKKGNVNLAIKSKQVFLLIVPLVLEILIIVVMIV